MAGENGKQEFEAVRGAMARRSGIITDNLDSEFARAKSSTIPAMPIVRSNQTPVILGANRAGRGAVATKSGMVKKASGWSADRVYDVPYNPFRNRLTVETPRNIVELNARYRFYTKYEPLVGAAIELHTEFPISGFNIDHEENYISDFFNEMMERLDMFDFITQMASEYWTLGECFPFGFFDDPHDPTEWEKFILINPDNVEMTSHPMVLGRHNYNIFMTLDPTITKIVENGPGNDKTGSLYEQIPIDIIEHVKAKKPLQLNDLQVSHFKRRGDAFNLRGESILSRILHLMAYRDKLRDAQYAIADRHATPKEFYFIGDKEQPADEEELQAFADLLSNTWMDPNQAIVWHHAVNVQMIGAADKVLPLRNEFSQIETEMLTALMMSKAFVHGEGPTYANASVGLDVLIARYLSFRTSLEKWMMKNVFEPMCVIHDLYKPSKADVDHRIKTHRDERPLYLPTIKWEKNNLRNNENKIKLLQSLMEKGLYPRKKFYRAINEDPQEIERMLNEEVRIDVRKPAEFKPTKKPAGGGLPPMPDAPSMPDLGGGGGLPEPPEGLGLPEAGSPLEEVPGAPTVPTPPPPLLEK